MTALRRFTIDPCCLTVDCMVCGLPPVDHITDCPHTADSLTAEQIGDWLDGGGQLDVALDASPRLRLRLRELGIMGVMTPTLAVQRNARQRIADELNRR